MSQGPDSRSRTDRNRVGTTINQVRRKLRWDGPATVVKDIMAAVIGLLLGAALVLVIWPDPGSIRNAPPAISSAEARTILCEQYILRDTKARYRYQRAEYLLSEVVDGNRSRIDYGTLVNHLAKDDWDSVRLVGEVGVGKSTMVKRVAARFCLDTPVPVMRLNLDELSLTRKSSAADAVQVTAAHLDLPLETIRTMRSRRLVLLLDGIDRLPSARHATVADFIKALVKPAADIRLVLISKRGVDFFRALDNPEWVTYELPPLTGKESKAYLRTKAKDPNEYAAFETWLSKASLDLEFEQVGLATPSAVYLSTYDDAKIVWELFQEQPLLHEAPWSMADLYLRFILRSVKARDQQLTTLAKVQGWLDDATPAIDVGNHSQGARLKWTLIGCEAAAKENGLPDPAAHCEHLFARTEGGLQFESCGAEEGCWILSYQAHDDLFRARRLARKVAESQSCERERADLMHNVEARAAMVIGQAKVRQLCLPLILQSLCDSKRDPGAVVQHVLAGFPFGGATRVEELGRFEAEPSLSGCVRQSIKRLME